MPWSMTAGLHLSRIIFALMFSHPKPCCVIGHCLSLGERLSFSIRDGKAFDPFLNELHIKRLRW